MVSTFELNISGGQTFLSLAIEKEQESNQVNDSVSRRKIKLKSFKVVEKCSRHKS